MIKTLILNEKHGNRYIHIPEGKEKEVILEVIKERFLDGWYDDEKEDDCLLIAARTGCLQSAASFFNRRQNAEYEGWEIAKLEEVL
jgi:hypothetical protein